MVNGDIVWKLGKLQSVIISNYFILNGPEYKALLIISTIQLNDSMRQLLVYLALSVHALLIRS
jgi:hypothetical protein